MKSTETHIIDEILKSVEVLGIKGTKDVLKNARTNMLTLTDNRVEYVLKIIANHYNIPAEEIINSHSKSTNRMFALRFSVYMLYYSFKFSYSDLKKIFKRDRSLLFRFTKEINDLLETNQNLKNTKTKFELLITEYKIQNQIQ